MDKRNPHHEQLIIWSFLVPKVMERIVIRKRGIEKVKMARVSDVYEILY